MIGAVVVLIGVSIYLGYTILATQTKTVTVVNNDSEYLKLESFVVQQDAIAIGDIQEGMKLKKGEPLTLRANFSNPNSHPADFIVVSQVWNSESQDVARSSLQSKLADSGLVLDTFWNPSEAGKYTITIYVLKASDFNRTGTIPPVVSVNVIVED